VFRRRGWRRTLLFDGRLGGSRRAARRRAFLASPFAAFGPRPLLLGGVVGRGPDSVAGLPAAAAEPVQGRSASAGGAAVGVGAPSAGRHASSAASRGAGAPAPQPRRPGRRRLPSSARRGSARTAGGTHAVEQPPQRVAARWRTTSTGWPSSRTGSAWPRPGRTTPWHAGQEPPKDAWPRRGRLAGRVTAGRGFTGPTRQEPGQPCPQSGTGWGGLRARAASGRGASGPAAGPSPDQPHEQRNHGADNVQQ
jgi:hypothetical protein